jgi:SAM-dependent methyltransferase
VWLDMQAELKGVVWLNHPDGRVSITEQPDGRRHVKTYPNPGVFVSAPECTTAYPVALIEQIFKTKSLGYLCDEISRDEDPDYVEFCLRCSLLGYLPPERFRGGRMLDFASGSGASTVILARLFPETELVGVELEPALIEIARKRAEHYELAKLVFLQSPSGDQLPPGLGSVQFINLGAVYEHLLPDERKHLLAQLWALLDVGGVIFVNQLPFRYYPIEAHTTGLPLINYLPDQLACAAATRYSKRVRPDASWPDLLRKGVRGGTARSVHRDLLRGGGQARMLKPTEMGFQDHADLWYAYSIRARAQPIKRVMRAGFKAASAIVRTPVAPGLSLAFEKLA